MSLYKQYKTLKTPGVHRNDRIWLAADHIVDPRINFLEKPKALIQCAEEGASELNLVDYQKPNTTIMHTEFYRQRAQPGMVILGADSHTCSSGALGALAVGLGALDVVFPMITGETFFEVPEVVRIEITGRPGLGITGKDVIMHILGRLGRNTVAAGRAVEYGGEGMRFLSCDARFAMANMSTEFGAIAGVCVPDQQTAAFISQRNRSIDKNEATYFCPDEKAEYCEKYTIDLQDVQHTIAIYPSPDNVEPIEKHQGKRFDGVFIGACTTTEEELILAALVLKAGLDKGLKPIAGGNRRVTPGSLSIISHLRKHGLLDVYERAAFTVGVPGCSYCVGMGADQAGEGEVWLSSQNRNFQNRMGKGSIANLAAAVTVAASSFTMTLTDPKELLEAVDQGTFERLRKYFDVQGTSSVLYSEPSTKEQAEAAEGGTSVDELYGNEVSMLPASIASRIQRFGDDIDTDAIIPIDKCLAETEEELGRGAFAYARPEFFNLCAQGRQVIVAGRSFGSGSSREEAPRALKAAGVQAVIAPSFAYIYNRNQANVALFGIRVRAKEFYRLAQEGKEVNIFLDRKQVEVDGQRFPFQLDAVELKLQQSGGLMKRWSRDGKQLFRKLALSSGHENCGTKDEQLQW